jgi:acyl carrier protein
MERVKAAQLVRDSLQLALELSPSEYTEQSAFKEMGYDSLSIMHLAITLEDKLGFEISDEDLYKLKTVGDLIVVLTEKY